MNSPHLDPLTEAVLIGAMALVTFAIRYGVLAVSGRLTLPPDSCRRCSMYRQRC
jgi:branched-subunit amino acid transport protein